MKHIIHAIWNKLTAAWTDQAKIRTSQYQPDTASADVTRDVARAAGYVRPEGPGTAFSGKQSVMSALFEERGQRKSKKS